MTHFFNNVNISWKKASIKIEFDIQI